MPCPNSTVSRLEVSDLKIHKTLSQVTIWARVGEKEVSDQSWQAMSICKREKWSICKLGKSPRFVHWAAPKPGHSKMTVFCVNGKMYNRIRVLLCSEKRRFLVSISTECKCSNNFIYPSLCRLSLRWERRVALGKLNELDCIHYIFFKDFFGSTHI